MSALSRLAEAATLSDRDLIELSQDLGSGATRGPFTSRRLSLDKLRAFVLAAQGLKLRLVGSRLDVYDPVNDTWLQAFALSGDVATFQFPFEFRVNSDAKILQVRRKDTTDPWQTLFSVAHLLGFAGAVLSTKAQAEAGIDTGTTMTPARTREAIIAYFSSPVVANPDPDDDSVRIATTAWVRTVIGTALTGVTLTGTPKATTPAAGDSSQRIATTEWAQTEFARVRRVQRLYLAERYV